MALTQSVRIIGGKWRSRKIYFPPIAGLRPTHDRIRETLFNWLAPHITQAKCLDCFAGSGALGFEALSRGASLVCFIDNNKQVVDSLNKNFHQLGGEPSSAAIFQGHCPDRMPKLTAFSPFDIIFLDPPYHQNLLQQAVIWFSQHNVTHEGSYIYMERESSSSIQLPPSWHIHRSQQTRTLTYELLKICSIE